jgi:hypothetical protein
VRARALRCLCLGGGCNAIALHAEAIDAFAMTDILHHSPS